LGDLGHEVIAVLCIPLSAFILMTAEWREYQVDWHALDLAFTAYLDKPSDDTARVITTLLPPGFAERRVGVYDVDTAVRILNKLSSVEQLVRKGRRHALDVALALYSISDAAYSEWLTSMIPEAIHANPAAFLSALKDNPTRVLATCDIALETGLDYLEDREGEVAEFKRRIKKIERVKVPELEEQRKCVLEQLRAAISDPLIREGRPTTRCSGRGADGSARTSSAHSPPAAERGR